MSKSTTPNLIDQLSAMSAQRTVRTDHLHARIGALLAQLDPHVEVGTRVTVDGYTLAREEMCSNVGSCEVWNFAAAMDDEYRSEYCTDLDSPVGSRRYLHGDFNCDITGPSRSLLLAFATRAQRFVETLLAREIKQVQTLDIAIAGVEAALSVDK